MNKQTKEELVKSELSVLSVLRERLNSAITLYAITDDDINNTQVFDKARALANENREVIDLIKKHEEYLTDALKIAVDCD